MAAPPPPLMLSLEIKEKGFLKDQWTLLRFDFQPESKVLSFIRVCDGKNIRCQKECVKAWPLSPRLTRRSNRFNIELADGIQLELAGSKEDMEQLINVSALPLNLMRVVASLSTTHST